MATVGDQINGALRLIGQLAEGETPSGDTSADALDAFNQMVDSWSTERLSVFCTEDQTFTWSANTSSYTLGATGTLVGTRPILLDDSCYYIVGTISYPLTLINRQQYDAIQLKTNTSTIPMYLFANMTMPDATLYIYPVPTQALSIHLISVLALDQPATLATSLVIPPGYLRAFRFNLAVELAAEFGIEPPRAVLAIARKSKANLKAINNPMDVMAMPYGLIGRRWNNYNIYAGQ